jgi:hypothetical protein
MLHGRTVGRPLLPRYPTDPLDGSAALPLNRVYIRGSAPTAEPSLLKESAALPSMVWDFLREPAV